MGGPTDGVQPTRRDVDAFSRLSDPDYRSIVGNRQKDGKQFHAEGAHIVFSARRQGDLNRVVDKCVGPGDTVVLPLDVIEESAVSATTEEILARFGRIDILVNNAELTQRGRIVETNLDVYRRIMDVNFSVP